MRQEIDKPESRKLPLREKLLFWIFTVGLIYVFIELASFTFLEFLHIRSSSYRYPKGMYIYDEKIDYRYKPNFRGHFSSSSYSSIPIVINSLGFRDYVEEDFFQLLVLLLCINPFLDKSDYE